MAKWLCSVCNVYEYDSDKGDPLAGIIAGLEPREFPKRWSCPTCGADKSKQIEIPEEDYR